MPLKFFAAATSLALLGACATMPTDGHADACPPGQTDAQCMHHCPMMDEHATGDHHSTEHPDQPTMQHDMHGQDMTHCPMMEHTPDPATPDPHH